MQQPALHHHIVWWICGTIGRGINVFLGGSIREKLCARAYRESWHRTVAVIDWCSVRVWARDTQHCRRCHLAQVKETRHARDQT